MIFMIDWHAACLLNSRKLARNRGNGWHRHQCAGLDATTGKLVTTVNEMHNQLFNRLPLILAALLTLQTDASGVEFQKKADRAIPDSAAQVAELFRGIDDGLIDVKFIPRDAAKANVLLRNNTDQVVDIQLPSAFAAVPVLAQFGPNGGGQNFGAMDGLAGGRGQGDGATQGVGGGINAGQGQGVGQGMQGMQFGGVMRIQPGKTRKLTATTVCLEHGKTEPNPRLAYRMIPLEQFSDDPRVAELCGRLGRGEIKQNTAQAAAWHLTNGLSWQRLASINRLESRYLGNVPFFSNAELKNAESLVVSLSTQNKETGSTSAKIKKHDRANEHQNDRRDHQ